MNKYKIYVYAICKNEEKHIERWVNNVKSADAIYVLDTGSTDNSVKLLKEKGVNVKVINYKDFKFDEARNESLNLVPSDADICVCTDLDELLCENWREILESTWQSDTDRIRYNMNFSFDEDGNPVSTYFISKIHKKDKYKWTHSIHEVLEYTGEDRENIITSTQLTIGHYPEKAKSRSFYLNLLEQAVKENPENDRDMHYLGREYMYNKDWNNCIDTLIKHVYLKSSTWNEEKSASMRFISRAYVGLKRFDEAQMWLKKAIELTPYIREPYIEIGLLYYGLNKYDESIEYLEKGLLIKEKSPTYINEDFAWNETPFDILSLCYYNTKDYNKSISCIKEAIKLNPHSERLKQNCELIVNKSKELS